MTDKAPSVGKDDEPSRTAQDNDAQTPSDTSQASMTFRPPKPESDSEGTAEEDTGNKDGESAASEDSAADNEDEESEEDDDDEDSDEEDDEDDEPRLKYARLTQHLGPVYRNGDATSSFLVAGDKMVCEPRA